MPKMCTYLNCRVRASYGYKYEEPEFCKEHGIEQKAFPQYNICKCGKTVQPRFAYPADTRASCCSLCREKDMINVIDRRCKCDKHLASFGFPTDKRGCYCHECKKDGMINFKTRNKRCICGLVIPSFGMKGDKHPSCCVKCKKEGMISLVNDLCACGTNAVFGFVNDKKPTYCLKCKKDGMENIITKKCSCGKAVPVFGLKTDKIAKYCKSCKTDEMINISAKMCKCGKAQPTFGLKEDKKPSCCISCKETDMIDIRSKRCICGKAQPVFGLKDDKKSTCCASCKTNDMVNIVAKMCKCGKSQPVYGLENDKKATCCATCKTTGMIDIVSTKCKGTFELQELHLGCPYSHRGKKKYSYYCTYCFQRNFPDDPRTALIKKKSDELKVRDYLVASIKEYSFIHDKTLWTGQADCTCRRRIDFRTLIGNTLLCIEIDEHQHDAPYYKDDELRYDDLMMLHGGKFVFIRLNPHSYINKYGEKKNPELRFRLPPLEKEIYKQIKRIESCKNTELLEIIHLYFDEA